MILKCPFNFDKLILDVTTRCNLGCRVCYSDGNTSQDLSFSDILNLSKQLKNKIISLCGGEPTLREDLVDIIRIFNKNNTVFLITNGLRLENYAYVKKLKQSGLKYISLSFNGFTDDVYREINGVSLLNIKLRALKNIKKIKINTILSVLIARGINENQIKDIFRFCLSNTDFIKELRIRAMTKVGRFLPAEKYTIPQLLDIVCTSIDIDKEDAYREFRMKKLINELMKGTFVSSNCSFSFHLKKSGGSFIPIGKIWDMKKMQNPFFKKMLAPAMLLKAYGLKMTLAAGIKTIFTQRKPWIHDRNILKIGLRSWPDLIDAPEFETCRTGYYYNNNIVPFCYANILRRNEQGIACNLNNENLD